MNSLKDGNRLIQALALFASTVVGLTAFFVAVECLADVVVFFSPSSVPIPNRVFDRRDSQDVNALTGTNWLAVTTLPTNGTLQDWKVEGGVVVELTQADKDAIAAWNADQQAQAYTNFLAQLKARTVALIDAADEEQGRLIRAMAEVMLDGFNAQAAKINGIKSAIVNGANIADIKAQVAAIPDAPTYDLQQLKTAIQGKLNDD